jgi:hypothetical protein
LYDIGVISLKTVMYSKKKNRVELKYLAVWLLTIPPAANKNNVNFKLGNPHKIL